MYTATFTLVHAKKELGMDPASTRKRDSDREREPLLVVGYRSENYSYRCAAGIVVFVFVAVIGAAGVLIWVLTRQANGGGGTDPPFTIPTDPPFTDPPFTIPTDPWPDDPTLLRLSMTVRRTMDTDAADPCENFMQYSCGGWLKNNPLPFSANHINRFMNTILSNVESLKDLVEGDDGDEIEAVRLAREFYSSCMDTDAIDDRGVQPLRDLVQLTGGWTAINVQNCEQLNICICM